MSSRVDPRSDSEALDLGAKKFAEMARIDLSRSFSGLGTSANRDFRLLVLQAQLFYGEQPCPVRFHVNNYARGLLIIGIGPESVTQLELNCSSAQRPGNVLRLWMNWILRELLALFVLHFIESGTQGERLRPCPTLIQLSPWLTIAVYLQDTLRLTNGRGLMSKNT